MAKDSPFGKKFRKGISGRSFVKWAAFDNGQDGTNGMPLCEPIPQYFQRPDDDIIQGKNNTHICFGRDRTGKGELDISKSDKGDSASNSLGKGSYGDHMGAGSIDLVAGRGAPFPMQLKGISLGPLYQTKYDIVEYKSDDLRIMNGPDPVFAPHPAYAMDASRILISQMTRADTNFGIETNIMREGSHMYNPKSSKVPYSAIVLKSDQLRFHAREDIKIVTGGDKETKNSQGEPTMTRGGIHLMAQNQKNKQQPIPLGTNLLALLAKTLDKLESTLGILITLTTEQMEFNEKLIHHRHVSPFYGQMCAPDYLTSGPKGLETVKKHFTNVVDQARREVSNITYLRTTFLDVTKDTYINSLFNTTN